MDTKGRKSSMAKQSTIILWAVVAAIGLSVTGGRSAAVAWPQFRGPQASGVATGSFPTVFGPKTNVVWQVEVPPGHSSPCIWEDYIFITGVQGERLETIAYSRREGRELWRQAVLPEKPERGLGAVASPTPATDGKRVYGYFGAFGVVCYDFAGRELWRRPLPTPVTQHGSGASPVVAGGVVVINRDADVEAHLLAISAEDGRTLWQVNRPEVRRGFCTPLLWPAERPELVILPGTLQLAAYQLKDGAAVWRARGLPNEMVASPIFGDGLFFAAGWTPGAGVSVLPSFDELLAQGDQDKDGRLSREEAPAGTARRDFTYVDADKDGFIQRAEWESIKAIYEKSENALLAVRPGGEGDVTETHVVWKQQRGLPYVPTPLYYAGRVYLVKNGGLFSCFEARTGRPLYQEERLGALGDYYASPVAAGGKILVCSQAGMAVVIKAADTLEVLARNPLGERIMATPAIVENRLYLRTQSKLYAFGE